jgi:hypothetical protein
MAFGITLFRVQSGAGFRRALAVAEEHAQQVTDAEA